MSSNNASKPHSHGGSIIGVGTRIVGDISFAGGMRIDGEVTGNIGVPTGQTGTLTLGQQCRVEGKLTAPRILINGTLTGPTIATDFVELQSHARVDGNIYYKSLAMQPGAVVHGQLVHCISNESSGALELVYEGGSAPLAAVSPSKT